MRASPSAGNSSRPGSPIDQQVAIPNHTTSRSAEQGPPQKALWVFVGIAGTTILGAALWRIMRWPPGAISHYAGVAMIVSGTVAVSQPLVRTAGIARTIVAIAGAAVIGGACEIHGLYQTRYGFWEYTDLWQPSVTLPGGHLYPLFLPLVWGMILAGCYGFARQRVRGPAAVIVAVLLATTTDLVAEPVFTGPVGFWVWQDPIPLLAAPLSNILFWVITSLLGCTWYALVLRGRRPSGSEPTWLIGLTLLGIAIIGATHGEPRGLWSLVILAAILAWRPKPLQLALQLGSDSN